MIEEKPQKTMLQKHAVRMIASVGLLIVGYAMWWYGKHPPSFSPPSPAAPYHYSAVQPIPIGRPYPPSVPKQTFYTIQLMGSYQRAEALRYVQQHALQKTATVYQETYQEKPWYIVGYGHYASRAAAKAALPALKSQRFTAGWVRPMHEMVDYVPFMQSH